MFDLKGVEGKQRLCRGGTLSIGLMVLYPFCHLNKALEYLFTVCTKAVMLVFIGHPSLGVWHEA